jgi:hypothetical protein
MGYSALACNIFQHFSTGKDGKRWEKMGKDDHPHEISMKFPRFRWPRRFCLGVSCADIFAQ